MVFVLAYHVHLDAEFVLGLSEADAKWFVDRLGKQKKAEDDALKKK